VFGRRVAVRFASGAAMRVRARRGRARARGQRDFGTRPVSDGGGPHVEHMVSHGGRVPFVVCTIRYYFFFPYPHEWYTHIYIHIYIIMILYIDHIIYFEVYALCETFTFTCNSHGDDLPRSSPPGFGDTYYLYFCCSRRVYYIVVITMFNILLLLYNRGGQREETCEPLSILINMEEPKCRKKKG